jgi:hypothetical protein
VHLWGMGGMADAAAPGGYRWLGTTRAVPLTRRVPSVVLAGRLVAVIEPISRCRATI